VTVEITCDLCGDPTDGYVCRRDTQQTERYLRDVVDLAGEVETTVARLARYATRAGRRAAEVEEPGPGTVNRRQPVEAFGWPASRDRPKPGGLRPGPLPVDLNASNRAAIAFAAVNTWSRWVEQDHGGTIPTPSLGQHPAAAAAAWLIDQLDWMRHQRQAEEAFTQLQAAGATIRRIVDAPPEQVVVGVCDCGTHLYARQGATTVTCPDCSARWDVEASREGLRETLRGYLVTAAEAAVFLAFFGLTGDRNRSRKTIVMWAQRGLIEAHGQVDGGPAYLFGEILDRATRTAQQQVAA
jgi:hypothetical protein